MSTRACAFALLGLVLPLLLPRPARAQFIWVANAGEDTVSKIDTINNVEVARYRTWFGPTGPSVPTPHLGNPWAGPAPSRIAVDAAGDAFVLDRFFGTICGGSPHLPVLVKVLPSGGTSTTTSTGQIALPMLDNNGNCKLDAGDTKDARIAWAVDVGTPGESAGTYSGGSSVWNTS